MPWFNNEAIHSLPLSINMFYQAWLTSKSLKRARTIHLYFCQQFPVILRFTTIKWCPCYSVGHFLPCSHPNHNPIYCASYVLFPVNERISKAKLLTTYDRIIFIHILDGQLLFDLTQSSSRDVWSLQVFAVFDYEKTFFGQWNTAVGLFLISFSLVSPQSH